MAEVEHYSQGERTIIWHNDAELGGPEKGVGVILTGSTVAYQLFPLRDGTLEQYLNSFIAEGGLQSDDAMSAEQLRQVCFELVTAGGNRVIAMPTFQKIQSGVDVPVAAAVAVYESMDYNPYTSLELSPEVIREMKAYAVAKHRGARDEEIQDMFPAAPKRNEKDDLGRK